MLSNAPTFPRYTVTCPLHNDTHGIPPPLPEMCHWVNTSWILTDFETVEDGPTILVPGSHRFGRVMICCGCREDCARWLQLPRQWRMGRRVSTRRWTKCAARWRVRWYRSPIDPRVLRSLMQRSDLKGWFQAVGPLLLVAASGVLTWHLFVQQMWIGFAAALFLHGTMGSIYGAANHELTHGTVFRTKALNQVFKRCYALLTWFNFHDYAMSHTYHHRYTLHPNGDREEVLPRSPTFRFFFLVQILTLNFTGGPHTAGLIPIIGYTVKTALNRPSPAVRGTNGSPKDAWLAAVYAGHPEERRKSVRWARMILLFHALVLATAIVFGLWLLPVLVSLPIFIANFWRYVTQPADALRAAHQRGRLSQVRALHQARSAEHVPVLAHELAPGASHVRRRAVATTCADSAKPSRPTSPNRKWVFAAWREMRAAWRRQQIEPGYGYDVPLPASGTPAGRRWRPGKRPRDRRPARCVDRRPRSRGDRQLIGTSRCSCGCTLRASSATFRHGSLCGSR